MLILQPIILTRVALQRSWHYRVRATPSAINIANHPGHQIWDEEVDNVGRWSTIAEKKHDREQVSADAW